MLKDITFGQYFPTGSFLHKCDARTKILSLIFWIVILFTAGNFYGLILTAALVMIFAAVSKIPLRMYLKNVKAVWTVILFTSVINALYIKSGRELFRLFGSVSVTTGGIERAVFMSVRIILLILISAMFTYTTKPTEITDSIESLLSPLNVFGLREAVHILAMTMTIALRFIPTLIDETEKIMNAQKARGSDFESGSFINRIKSMLPILIPLLVSSVRRAYELAEAMESRCYNGSKGRTKYKISKFGTRDLICAVTDIFALASVIVLNIVS